MSARSPLLQPGPALVYLVLLLSLVGFWIRDALVGRGESAAPAEVPAILSVAAEDARASEPLLLAGEGGATVIRFDGVAPAGAAVTVELTMDGAPSWSGPATADGDGTVTVVVRAALPTPGGAVELVVRRGEAVLARRLATPRGARPGR